MSNYRRSWSRVGKRTEWKNQQEFANGYLYSAIEPTTGDSFHLIGFDATTGLNTKIFLEKLKEEHKESHLLIIWDNAPFHKLKALHEIAGITILSLPSYSPQLNPPERFFEELRKSTANRIFENIDEQEKEIEKKIIEYLNDKDKLKQLTGYDWILEQRARVF